MLVEYDNSPVRYLETVPPSDFVYASGPPNSVRILKPTTDNGRIGNFEFSEGTYYNNVHYFGG